MKLRLFITLCIINVNFAYSKDDFADTGWIKKMSKNNITIYAKDSKKSPIKSLKAVGIINSKIKNIVSILRDVDTATKWLPNLNERSYIQNISDIEAILYDVNAMPWPVADRELVVHHKLKISEDKRSLILNFISTDKTSKKKNINRVRAKILFGTMKFIPMGDKTKMIMTMLVDPKGKIPVWAINLLQVQMPYDFMMALNKYAAKSKLAPLPGIQKLIDQLVL